MVADGVLIAESAVRMATKNFLLRSALRDHLDYNQASLSAFTRTELRHLADENLASADRLAAVDRPPAESTKHSEAQRMHYAALQRAPDVHRRLAHELQQYATDDAKVADLVASAQQHAADELRHELTRKLAGQVVEPDVGYDTARPKRLRKLIKSDLKHLRRQHRTHARTLMAPLPASDNRSDLPDTQPDTSASARWIATTPDAPWQEQERIAVTGTVAMPDVIGKIDDPKQTVEGFGASFNELGWTSLSILTDAQRDEIFREVFAPGVGAALNLCRMPIGANDFSRDWYSYDETADDFSLEHFDISNDLDTLVPFIHAAQKHQPDLQVWASPWSPPTWMKTNQHYAGAQPHPFMSAATNGLREDQIGHEGTDMFRVEEPYLRVYADYFGRFIDAYRQQNIPISMVMPQNEFNSPQVFPSCTWTPGGLAQFLHHLAPVMQNRGVDIFLGTLERGDDHLVRDVLNDPAAAAAVTGLGVQWEGKRAAAALHALYPALRIYQTEQECGDGANDSRQARHAWSLMKHFFDNGANAYMYWNISLLEGGLSRWGWTQNSLVTVDADNAAYRFTPDYYALKHVSAFVQPGARVIHTWSLAGYDNQLVFLNPDGSSIIVIENDTTEVLPVHISMGDTMISPTLSPQSLNTFILGASEGN
ncbi:beta-glycosidase [Microbacterium sp. cf046]|uniref:glycoside hydrolase family 30 protein n=1 Tax=Microbacterium sp. cf046 TaxID=1761803 RepID=UPI000AE5AD86|nr:beta-glycosidase [Microbacterium sp. cf046]